ncbi:MAG: tetratricopeptide repeat protein [Saprospirales bacterium]|nr:tetratricopeptide repeat protein [Saprospirales bacterium]
MRNGQDQIGRNVTSQTYGNDNLWHLRQAEILISQQNIEEALLELDLAVAQDPYLADAYLLRARLKNQIGMQTEAQQDLQTALRLNPYAANLYGYNGPFGQLQLLATLRSIEVSAEGTPNPLDPYYQILDDWNNNQTDREFVYSSAGSDLELDYLESAVSHLEQGQWQKALGELELVLSYNPRSPIAHDLKGMVLLQNQRLDEVESSLRKAVELAPDFALAWYNLSRLYEVQGKEQEALAHLDKAIALQEDHAKAYFDRARLRGAQGDTRGALADYNEAIAAQSEPYLQAYLNRGLTRKMLGDFGGALADINHVIELEGTSPELLKTRGNIHLIYGLYNKALLDLTTAIQLAPNFAEAWFNRGIAHLLNGDPPLRLLGFSKKRRAGV